MAEAGAGWKACRPVEVRPGGAAVRVKHGDVKVPLAAYGVIRSQSTTTTAPPRPKSLTTGRRLAETAAEEVNTGLPSIENVIELAPQSIR